MAIELAAAALGFGLAWMWFAWRAPTHVLIGTTIQDALVPAHYQASAFLAFFALAARVVLQALHRRRDALATLALLASSSVLASARLLQTIPLSGHAVFLSAALVFEVVQTEPRSVVAARDRVPRAGTIGLAIAGLVVTTWYKLFVWGDVKWWAVSVAAGIALGWACSLLGSRKAGARSA